MGGIVRCRKCGKKLMKERVDYDHIHWKCECGFRTKTPHSMPTTRVNPYESIAHPPFIRLEEERGVMKLMGEGEKESELLSFEELTLIVSSGEPLEKILSRIVRRIANRLGVEVCSIYLHRRGKLTLAATWGLRRSLVGKVSLKVGEGITGWAAKNRELVSVPDAPEDERYHFVPDLGEEKFRGMISCPILDGRRLLGVVNVQTRERREFSRFEKTYVHVIASLLRFPLRERMKKG